MDDKSITNGADPTGGLHPDPARGSDTTAATSKAAACPSIARRLVEHGLIAVFMGVFVAISLATMSPLAPLRLMEWLGADAVSVLAASTGKAHDNWEPHIVFVTIDDLTMMKWGSTTSLQARGHIGRLTKVLRHSGAKVVVLDVLFDRSPLKLKDNEDLKRAISDGGAPLVLASPLSRAFQSGQHVYQELWPGEAYPNPLPSDVQFAASFLQSDFVRTQTLQHCVRSSSR